MYEIKEDYVIRPVNEPCPQIGAKDECQNEVYAYGAKIRGVYTVMDIGTGSGYKLMKYFHNRYTLGTDIEPNLSLVRELYPEVGWKSRFWALSDLHSVELNFDLIICADVIEHLSDPDILLSFIDRSAPRYAIISTPDRDAIAPECRNGPPRNTTHVREWNAPEFRRYLEKSFNIVEHVLPSPGSSTQFALLTMRR